MKKLIILSILFLPSVTRASNKAYEAILDTYVGHSIDEVIDKAGYPTQTFEAPNGNKVFAWQQMEQRVRPTFQGPSQTVNLGYGNSMTINQMSYGGGTYTLYCNTYFETDVDNFVIRWKWEGNACGK